MDKPILNNKDQFPTEGIIFSHLGRTKIHWKSVFQYIYSNHPDFSEEWRYYNDGKSWLMKVTRKSKTIFWLSVIQNAFRITFYFGDKAEPAILKSKIPANLKKQFKDGKRYGKIRDLTLIMKNKQNIEAVKELIHLKMKV
ncbi:MAG: DUF3788 family protein [Ignavibacteriaceae bacterium]